MKRSDSSGNLVDHVVGLSSIQRAALRLELKKKRASATGRTPIPVIKSDSPASLSFAQQRLWFLDRLDPGRSVYNIPIAYRLRGPLDAAALERSLGEHVLLVVMHHIVSDGWSVRVLYRELSQFYQAFSVGKPSPLSELSLQYADFAAWQRECLRGNVLQWHLAHWKKRLEGLSGRRFRAIRERHNPFSCLSLSPGS